MTGAPREVYADSDFVIVRMTAVRALDGSWEAAGCFQRIAWRCERDGTWTATMQEIADQIGVSVRTAQRITNKLRDLGWVTSEREQSYDPTLTWRVVWADGQVGSHETTDQAASDDQSGSHPDSQIGSHSSTETGETKPKTGGRKRRPEIPLPDDFEVTDGMKSWFAEQEWKDAIEHPGAETQRFLESARANDRRYRDWQAAWRQWMIGAGTRYAGRRAPLTNKDAGADGMVLDMQGRTA